MTTMRKSLRMPDSVHQVSDRAFGLVLSGIFTVLSLWPLIFGFQAKSTLLIVAGILFLIGVICPGILKWPKIIWFFLTDKIARVFNWVLLSVIFFCVVTPVSLFFKIIQRDTMNRKWNETVSSYWVKRTGNDVSSDMRNQF